jgi:hypothetical protein
VAGGWRSLHNEELRNLYVSPNIVTVTKSRKIRWAGHVERIGEMRNTYTTSVGNPEGKTRLGRPRRRWEDNIRMDLIKLGWKVLDWIYLAQDMDQWRALMNTVMNFQVPLKVCVCGGGGYFLTS